MYLSSEEIHVWFSSIHQENFSSREVLRLLLARYLNTSPDSLIFQKTAQGKLFLPKHPDLFFNIAHSGDLLALAFSHAPVGIDVEKKRKVKALALARKFFSLEEMNFITSKGKDFVEERFLQLWTAKEAVLKADGRGITKGLRKVFAVIENEKISALTLEKKWWSIGEKNREQASSCAKEYLVAVASSMKAPLIRWYDSQVPGSLINSCHFKILT